jgi:hypothetical protein
MLFYSLEDESRPTGTVVNIGLRRILCKMDTRGRTVGLHPGDLRIIKKRKCAGQGRSRS